MKKEIQQESEVLHELGRINANAFYANQQNRIKAKSRIRDVIRKRNEGIDFKEVEKKKKKSEKFKELYKDKNLMKLLDQMLKKKKLTGQEHSYIQRTLETSNEAERYEKKYEKLMDDFVWSEDIYKDKKRGFHHIYGISTILMANLLKEFGYCERYEHSSSLWKHCGLHVVNGKAPKLERNKKIDWKPELRTLAWKISDSFVKQRTPVYRDIYDSEKKRQLALMKNCKCKNCGGNPTKHKRQKGSKLYTCKNKKEYNPSIPNAPMGKLHAELRARRKTGKIFLHHYWIEGRTWKNLEISKPYPIDKLGHKHYISFDEVLKANKEKKLKNKKKDSVLG